MHRDLTAPIVCIMSKCTVVRFMEFEKINIRFRFSDAVSAAKVRRPGGPVLRRRTEWWQTVGRPQTTTSIFSELGGLACTTLCFPDTPFLGASRPWKDGKLLRNLEARDLREFQPGGETDPWTRVINDNWSRKRSRFHFFPEQDLVVATFWSMNNLLVELHGFSFSRGSPHPRFVSATIATTEVPGTTMSLFLHSWKDGRVSQLRHPSKRAWWWCCAVLSHDTFALVENDSATLEVCRIEEPDSDTPSLRTLVHLGLPPLASWARISSSYCISEQMPVYSGAPSFVVEGRPPRRHPFHSSPEERIIAIAFRVKPYDDIGTRAFAIVTHLRTLVAHATTTLPQGNFIPWKDWGPSGAACFERHTASLSDLSDACVVGERLATLSPGELSIFDFNPTRVQNTIRKAGHPSQDAVYSVVKDRVLIPREELFKIDVVSELPYVSVTVPRPSHWWRIHNYEEVLAGSSVSVDVRGRLFPLFVALGIDCYQTDRINDMNSTFTPHDKMISTGSHPRCVRLLIQWLRWADTGSGWALWYHTAERAAY
ncbi:hypothetical protein BC826DRAFT_973137 [Russula brevipes]|nr:hypothetical protein BC826DRAFT_973137 [Russula brevipes]